MRTCNVASGTISEENTRTPELASFPGLPRFLFFGLRSVLYTEAEEREKRGRPGNTYHVNDVRWTRGGRRGGGVRLQVRAQ